MTPAPVPPSALSHPLQHTAATAFDTPEYAHERPLLPALAAVARSCFAALGQPQAIGDAAWENGLRRAGRELSEPEAGAYTRGCDRSVKVVQEWRLRHLIAAIGAEAPHALAPDWAADRARDAGRNWPLHQRQRLEDAALELLHRGYARFDPAQWRGSVPLATWARAHLRQRLIDQFRRGSWELALSDHHTSATDDTAETLAERFEQLRDAIDGANFFPTTPDGPDRYAALVFDLRVRLAERFARAAVDGPLDAASRWLPWPAWVGPRQFLPGLPTVSALWEIARDRTAELADVGRTAFVGRCVARGCDATGRGTPPNRTAWNQWIQHAKREVQARVTADVWELVLAVLFPQHESPEGQL